MKLLILHNNYQIRGGEDSVLSNEADLLSVSVDVTVRTISNDMVDGFFSKICTSAWVLFSIPQYLFWKRYIKKNNFDIVHVHNYFPLISPSIFYACQSAGVPVVHTLHNFRAICPTAILSYKGEVCEKSMFGSSWWAVRKRVYRGSYLGTFVLVLMIELHKRLGTWKRVVDGYIALTEFSKEKYIDAGWPRNKFYVKPNFVHDVDQYQRVSPDSPFALYVGRLSEEKGIEFILDGFKGSGLNLKIAGDGPLRSIVENNSSGNIEYLGALDRSDIAELMAKASCLVMASTWYEGFPMVIVEAFRSGLPAIVPKLGNMEAVVDDGTTGLHYNPGEREQFVNVVRSCMYNHELSLRLSTGAREAFLSKYSAGINRQQLLDIYDTVIQKKAKST